MATTTTTTVVITTAATTTLPPPAVTTTLPPAVTTAILPPAVTTTTLPPTAITTTLLLTATTMVPMVRTPPKTVATTTRIQSMARRAANRVDAMADVTRGGSSHGTNLLKTSSSPRLPLMSLLDTFFAV